MSAHTPGNWYAMTAEHGGVSDQANVFSDHETDGEPTFIADTLPLDDEVPLEQRRANAFLISAAPDLLELAKQFKATAEYYIRESRKSSDEEGARLKTVTLNMINAAIAKAEGRA